MHGIHTWNEDVFMCSNCEKLYHIDELKNYGVGEECACGSVLLPVPWRLSSKFFAVPGCHFCYEEKKFGDFINKLSDEIEESIKMVKSAILTPSKN